MRPIAVVGNVVLDVTVDVAFSAIEVGRQTQAPVGLQAGGGLPNVGALLETMGHPITALGVVGDDAAGRLVQEMVRWDLVMVPGASTEVSVIATRGDRTIVNSQGSAALTASQLEGRLPAGGVVLFAYLNCCSLAVGDLRVAVRSARQARCTVVGGLNGVFSEERRDAVTEVLEDVDLLVLNEAEADWLGTRARRTCITLGPAGLVLIDGGAVRRWTGVPIENGRSLGAGDAFLSGVVSALAEEAGWEAACERGMAVARRWVAGG